MMYGVMWKICVILVVLNNVNAFDEMPRLDPSISTVSPHSAPTSDSCVGQCAMIFVDEMNSQLGEGKSVGLLNLNYNEFLVAFSNVTFFEKFCEIYHNFQFCYSKCPHGYMQELLQRSSEIVDHFCVYNFKEIKERFGCLSQINQTISQQCLKTCTTHHNAVTSLMQNFKHLALNGDSTQAERHLSESCEYVVCTLNCDVPTIAHYCNFDTANLVINLTKSSFESIQKLALDTGAVSKWPEMCADIKNFALPKSPQTPPSDAENVIAQSPKVNSMNGVDPPRINTSYAEKSSFAFFGALTLISFGLLIR